MGINNPSYFPKGDDSWKIKMGIDRKGCDYYPYTDEQGNMYKGQYDQTKHFGSEQELKTYLSDMLNLSEEELSIKKMSL